MADIQRRQEERERGSEQRSQNMARRGESGYPILWNNSADLFSLSPFTLMRRLTEDMDRMFGGYGMGGRQNQGQEMGSFMPPVEVREENGNLIVSAELPGMNREDVNVQIENDALIIQ